ncbi:MAG TPA: hypothetical protein VJQ56_14605, partial [Blastocatellia bacterium]|nr:hypothetical protein [Blastocatellia bacterium]
MLRRLKTNLISAALILLAGAVGSNAATLSETLRNKLQTLTGSASAGVVIVSFNTNQGLNNSHLQILRNVGITRGLTLQNLGMVAMPATVAQVRALAADPAVRSVWSNDRLYYYMQEARMLTGVDRLRTDSRMTSANGGQPVSGKGDFSVIIND